MTRRMHQETKNITGYQGQQCVSAKKVRQEWVLARTPFVFKREYQVENQTNKNKKLAPRSSFSATRFHLQKYIDATLPVCPEVGSISRNAAWYATSDIGLDPKNYPGELEHLLHSWSSDWGEYLIQEGAVVLPIDLMADTKKLERQQSFFQNYAWMEAAQKQDQMIVVVSGLSQIQGGRQSAVFENIFRFCRNGLVPMVFLSVLSKGEYFSALQSDTRSAAKGFAKKLRGGRYYEAVQARKAKGLQRLPTYMRQELKSLVGWKVG